MLRFLTWWDQIDEDQEFKDLVPYSRAPYIDTEDGELVLLEEPGGEIDHHIPLVIAGPILRHVHPGDPDPGEEDAKAEKAEVNVWLALREACTVELKVWDAGRDDWDKDNPPSPGDADLSGSAETVEIGDHLHIVNVTATGGPVDRAAKHHYDLEFVGASVESGASLTKPGVLGFDGELETLIPQDGDAPGEEHYAPVVIDDPIDRVTIDDDPFPSLFFPPKGLEDLRILQGSCRGASAPRYDGMTAAYLAIKEGRDDPVERPNHLCLTGDQIYADLNGAPFVIMLVNHGIQLLGWEEWVPDPGFDPWEVTPDPWHKIFKLDYFDPWQPLSALFTPSFYRHIEAWRISRLVPSARTDVLRRANLKPAPSHILSFGEYCAMYCCVWSDVLWPRTLEVDIDEIEELDDAAVEDFHPYLGVRGIVQSTLAKGSKIGSFIADAQRLWKFKTGLAKTRKTLANVPTLTTFDDHEATDDWNLNAYWIANALKGPEQSAKGSLGHRVIRNGMAAFAVFQAWGNTPSRFEEGQPGRQILEMIATEAPTPGEPDDPDDFADDDPDEMPGLPAEIDDLLGLRGLTEDSEWVVTEDNEWEDDSELWWAVNEDLEGGWPLLHPDEPGSDAMTWDYAHDFGAYEIIGLDVRTRRGYTGDGGPAQVISERDISRQLGDPPKDCDVTIVMNPVPTWTRPLHETIQTLGSRIAKNPFMIDYEHWGQRALRETAVSDSELALERLLAELAARGSNVDGGARIVFLSGDVHYGYGNRASYWAKTPYSGDGQDIRDSFAEGTEDIKASFANLVASGFKNVTWFTSWLQEVESVIRLEASEEWEGEAAEPDRWTPYGMYEDAWTGDAPEDAAGVNEETVVGIRHNDPSSDVDIELERYHNPAVYREDLDNRDPEEPEGWDWAYLVEFLDGTRESLDDLEPEREDVEGLDHWRFTGGQPWVDGGEWGKLSVGFNNLGDVTFKWLTGDEEQEIDEDTKRDLQVTQWLWWRLGHDDEKKTLRPERITKWETVLNPEAINDDFQELWD